MIQVETGGRVRRVSMITAAVKLVQKQVTRARLASSQTRTVRSASRIAPVHSMTGQHPPTILPHWALPWIAVALALAATPAAGGTAPEPAPAFAVRDLEGKTLRLSDYRGQAVVLDFWATWCRPCRASMPHLDTLQARYRERGLVVLGLSVDDGGPDRVRRFADYLGIRFRIGVADQHVLDRYGPIRAIPTTFFIGRDGMVVRRVVGYIDPETLENYAREMLEPAEAVIRVPQK